MSPLLIAVLVTQATVYSWTDKAGVEHFTDDLSTVPKGVKVRTTDGDEIGVVRSDDPKPKPAAPVAAPAPVETGPAAPSTAEQTWRELFRAARNKVTVLEEEIEADRKKVEEVNGLPMSFGFNCGFYGGGYYAPGYPGAARLPPPINSTGVSVTATGQPVPGVNVGATVTGTSVIVPPRTGVVVSPYPYGVYGAPCGYAFSPEYAMIRDRLDRNRRELPRAREELADLERRAAYDAVPLHWRR